MARLVGNIIVDNFDRFTGEAFNATKVILKPDGDPYTDADVDNARLFKVPMGELGGGYAIRSNSGSMEIESFGAIGDGIIDDSEAFNLAFKSLPVGGKLILSDRTYRIDNNIITTRNTVIEGNGSFIIGVGQLYTNGITRGITFDGARVNLLTGALFELNKLINITGNAVSVYNIQKNVKIISNEFENIHHSGNYNATGCAIYQNGQDNVGTIDNLTIQGNIIKETYGTAAIFLNGHLNKLNVSGNSIDNVAGRGLNIFRTLAGTNGKIENNQITRCGYLRGVENPSGVGCNGIYFLSTFQNTLEVKNNTIKDVYENGIEGPFYLIENNTIENTGTDLVGHPTPSIEGIWDGINVINNTIINPAGHGLYLFRSSGDIQDRIYKDNTIQRAVSSDTYHGFSIRAVGVGSYVRNIVFQNNTVKGFDSVIDLLGGSSTIFENIVISNNTPSYCNKYYNNSTKTGVNLKGDSIYLPLFKDPYFENWTTSTTLTDWLIYNSIVQKVMENELPTVKLTANSDINKPRIKQIVRFPVVKNTGYITFDILVKGTNGVFLSVFPIIEGVETPEFGATYNFDLVEADGYKLFSLANIYTPSRGYSFAIYIGSRGITGDWIQLSQVHTYMVNK